MTLFAIAKIIHIVFVIVWIGGVSMVTTSILPAMQDIDKSMQSHVFKTIEHRFLNQARVSSLLVGMSGFYMLHHMQLWQSLSQYWWLSVMIVVWTLFSIVLWILEPLVMKSFCHGCDSKGMNLTRMNQLHWILLIVTMSTVALGVAGKNGLLF